MQHVMRIFSESVFLKNHSFSTVFKGLPVVFHWTVLLFFPWAWFRFGSLLTAIIAFPAYVALILVHEYGHALVARARGVRVHTLAIFIFHGYCRHDTPYHEKDDVLIAWGGVAAQLLLLLLFLPLWFVFEEHLPHGLQRIVYPLLIVFVYVNAFTMAFNLIPAPSFDGYKAWRVLFWAGAWFRKKMVQAVNWLKRYSPARRRRLKASSDRVVVDIMEKLQRK